jgi:hypothetical protein
MRWPQALVQSTIGSRLEAGARGAAGSFGSNAKIPAATVNGSDRERFLFSDQSTHHLNVVDTSPSTLFAYQFSDDRLELDALMRSAPHSARLE